MEEAVGAAVRFAAERAAETEREDVREIERLLAAFAAWADIGDENRAVPEFSNTCGILSPPMGRRRKPRPKFRLSKKHPQVL